jgi:glutamate synthase (NADPH/NADH) small chain
MQNFLNYDRVEPVKRDVFERLKDFKEIYNRFSTTEAKTQSSRCVQCGDPYCLNACPLSNYIPYWLKETAKEDMELAFRISNQSSPFPEIMGRVCPQDRLCEGSCTLNDGYGAITIGSIETFISETGFENGLKPNFDNEPNGKKIAIIGSGPAGMSCATYLLRNGFSVDMYERADTAGGLLTYGIPGFKLNKDVVKRRIDWLVEAGMNLHLNTEVGKDVSFKELEDNFDAIFIGIGATKSNSARLENEDANGSFMAIDFLSNVQKREFGFSYNNDVDVEGKKVVVIGGGDTAMDCVRTSVRSKAQSVQCLYRRDAESMPGSRKEYKNATEEGVEFVFNVSPKSIKTDENNNITSVVLEKTELAEADENGRQKLVIVDNSEYEIEADVVIFALGFSQEVPSFIQEAGLELDKWNGVVVNKNYQTSKENIYAGGDCYRGADLVVRAALDGRECAKAIKEKFLN